MLQGGNCLIYFDISFGKGMRDAQVSVLYPRFAETHALSFHTPGEVCRLENIALRHLPLHKAALPG